MTIQFPFGLQKNPIEPDFIQQDFIYQNFIHQDTLAGLPVLHIRNEFCSATISYQGAQVLHYQQTGESPLLWQSEPNSFQAGKAIRGGIPLCFPWFGQHPTQTDLPSHGFARNMDWQLQQATENAQGHHLTFVLRDNAATRLLWNHAFEAVMDIHLGEQLHFEFRVKNNDQHPFAFSFAWHSYFQIEDINQTQLHGLEHTRFLDQLCTSAGYNSGDTQPVSFSSETDRIYQQASGHYQIKSALESTIDIHSASCSSVVVWNPWSEKAARLNDMAKDAWKNMLCVECGQVDSATVQLAPAQLVSYQLTLSR